MKGTRRILVLLAAVLLCLALAGCGSEPDAETVHAILAEHSGFEPQDGHCIAAAYQPLLTETSADGAVLYIYYCVTDNTLGGDGSLLQLDSVYSAAALTFRRGAGGWTLSEFWLPDEGAGRARSIEQRFPEEAREALAGVSNFPVGSACNAAAAKALGADVGAALGAMLDEFEASGLTADEVFGDRSIAAGLLGWYGELSIEYFETELSRDGLSQLRRELLERALSTTKELLGDATVL